MNILKIVEIEKTSLFCHIRYSLSTKKHEFLLGKNLPMSVMNEFFLGSSCSLRGNIWGKTGTRREIFRNLKKFPFSLIFPNFLIKNKEKNGRLNFLRFLQISPLVPVLPQVKVMGFRKKSKKRIPGWGKCPGKDGNCTQH